MIYLKGCLRCSGDVESRYGEVMCLRCGWTGKTRAAVLVEHRNRALR